MAICQEEIEEVEKLINDKDLKDLKEKQKVLNQKLKDFKLNL